MKTSALALILFSSSVSFATECTYSAPDGAKETVTLNFMGSSAELIQMRFKGPTPDRYFAFSKADSSKLNKEFTQIATRDGTDAPLGVKTMKHSKILLETRKGGNLYVWQPQKGRSHALTCAQSPASAQ